MFTSLFLFVAVSTAWTNPATEPAVVEIRIPLTEPGRLDVSELVERLAKATGAPVDRPDSVWLPAVGVAGGLTTQWLENTLGPGVKIIHAAEQWVFRLDPELLQPERRVEWSDRLGTLASKARSQARKNARYGFHARPSYRANDPSRPSIVLIHGLNSTSSVFRHMVPLAGRGRFRGSAL